MVSNVLEIRWPIVAVIKTHLFRCLSLRPRTMTPNVRPMEKIVFDPRERAAEKEASRAEDARLLAEGLISADGLRQRNAPLAQLLRRPNFAASRMR